MPVFLFGIRWRLMTMILVLIVAMGALLLWKSNSERESAITQVEGDLLAQARLVATTHNQLIDVVADLLRELSIDPALRVFGADSCNEVLRRVTSAHSAYSNTAVVGRNGVVVCSANPDGMGAFVGDRPYFQETLRTRDLASSGYLFGRISNRPVSLFAMPLLDGDGVPVGVVQLSVNLAWLEMLFESLSTRADIQTTVLGPNGFVLLQVPRATATPVGGAGLLPWSGSAVRTTKPSVLEIATPGEEPVLGAVVPLDSHAGSIPGYVVVTSPKSRALAGANRTFQQALGVLGVMTVVGLTWSWGISTVSVLHPVQRLLRTAQRYSSGDFGARVGLTRTSSSEMASLAGAFESMADAVGEAHVTLRRNATTDMLTSLPNRMEMERLIDERIQQSPETPLLLLEVQLRQFGAVNATFGFDGGDELLRQIGPRLVEVFGSETLVGRTGGDEFMALLTPTIEDDASFGSAFDVSTTLEHAFERPFQMNGEPVYLGSRASLARYPENGTTAAALARRASLALRRTKLGHHGLAMYDAARDEPRADQLKLLTALRGALSDGDLEFYYQPQVDLQRNRIVGVEALMRWQREDGTFVPPAQFIGLAEQTGYVRHLTTWAVKTASQQAHTWQEAGRPVPIGVNVSAADFEDTQLAARITDIVAEWALPEGALDIEITETAILSDMDEAVSVCENLRRAGLDLSIDDFGTGYSPFVYLHRLPISTIKIDQSFVRDLMSNPRSRDIVESTIAMASRLGVRSIAEGVETQEVADLLTELGCDVAQGYYFARPMPAAQFEAWIQDNPFGLALGTGVVASD